MADITNGPNAPLSRGFATAGRDTRPVDWERDSSQDLSDPAYQRELTNENSQDAHVVAAALDCSAKSRAREIHSGVESFNSERYPLRKWKCRSP